MRDITGIFQSVCVTQPRGICVWRATEQDDIKELKRQLKIQSHQVDQIKEELAFKDALVTKVSMDRVGVEKEMENLKARQLHTVFQTTSTFLFHE